MFFRHAHHTLSHASRKLALGVTVGALAFGTFTPSPVMAQKKNMSRADRREAKRLFNQAHLAYRRGDYEEAILKWEQSYELSGEPLIFLSIANAYERLGEAEEALDYLKRWREKAPRREHEELDDRIASLERRVEEKKAEEEERKREEEQRIAEEKARQERERKAKLARLREQEEEDSSDVWTILGWSLVGTGGAAVIAGVIMDGVAASQRPSEEEACLQTDGGLFCRDSLRDDIESSNRLAIAGDATWIIGSLVAASGVVVLLTLPGSEQDGGDSARLSPWFSRSAGGVAVGGSF
jgi:tetratricopeptide (TPR) repeat protein